MFVCCIYACACITEPPSAIIDSWARGVVPQASETRLLSAMNTNDPITVLSREAMDVEDETRYNL